MNNNEYDYSKLTNISRNINTFIACFDNSEKYDLIQYGNTESDDNESEEWFKIRFKSGMTYVFTKSNYIKSILNNYFIDITDDLKNQIIDKINNNEELDANNLLTEEQKTDLNDYKLSRKVKDINISFIDIEDKKYTDDILVKIIENIFRNIKSLSDVSEVLLPLPSLITFNNLFTEIHKLDGSTNTNTDDATTEVVETSMIYNNKPCSFVKDKYNFNIDAYTWLRAIDPIAWTGVPCKRIAQKIEDLDDMDVALAGIEDLEIPVDDEEE